LNNLRQEINAIAQRTTFNGKSLLTGALVTQLDASSTVNAGFVVQAATNTSVTSIDVSQARPGATFTFADLGSGQLKLDDGTVSQTITVGAIAANGSITLNFDQLGVSITISSVSGETGANVAAGLNGGTIVTQSSGGSANFQVGPNASHYYLVGFQDVRIQNTGPLSGLDTALNNFNTSLGGTNSAQVSAAQTLITEVDGAISYVNNVRSELGAAQNRLEHTIANLGVQNENLTASESRIRDVDMAAEMVTFTRNQILQQAGVAVLAQANAIPQSVLQLLR
ncbi:MAG: flagellin, partial [Thermomicrobium sp.]|nr:flagellin [Thermomicrobium sp.]MDW8006623.1 flagellin [Thermomicrobium sp.]